MRQGFRVASVMAGVIGAAVFIGSAAQAELSRISDRAAFVQVVDGKTLARAPLIRLQVTSAGAIEGTGLGAPVTGTWTWQDGYFCREMAWSGEDLGYNCQEVRTEGDTIRFTSDYGQGDFADFNLR